MSSNKRLINEGYITCSGSVVVYNNNDRRRAMKVTNIMMMIVVGVVILGIVMGANICNGEGSRIGSSYHYLKQDRVMVESEVKRVYIDERFSVSERGLIEVGIERWNEVLNGYMRMDIESTPFNMEVEVVSRAWNGECYLVLRLDKGSNMIENEYGKMTLGYANKIGGSYLYLIPELMIEGEMELVIMHEVGHLLGARHKETGLMVSNYSGVSGLCIDEETVKQVGEYNGWLWGKMNYCVKD